MNAQTNPVEVRTAASELQGPPPGVSVLPGDKVHLNVHVGILPLVLWLIAGATAFHLANFSPNLAPLTVVYLFALVQCARAEKWRMAFYSGLALGFLVGVPKLQFFWTIFSAGAVALWLVFAFWLALFASMARLALRTLPGRWGWAGVPFIWTGLEYFRSELYYLKFSWLSPGYAFADAPHLVPLSHLGTYGIGFALMTLVVIAAMQNKHVTRVVLLACGTAAICGWGALASLSESGGSPRQLKVAGIQLEFPAENEVLVRLSDLIRRHPDAELLVLSEYTFTGPIPERVRQWCAQNRRHLVVGGTQPLPGGQFFNTAFVIGPDGKDLFRQVKGVPIQFFKDGLPAPEHKTWASPWGRLGLCICYDLSYTRITDRLVRDGAEALIVPTMDVMDWGEAQHKLHARVTPVRAAEYGVPIFRIASSGISQWADARGRVLGQAPCGEGQMLAATLELARKGLLPADRWLAPAAVVLTAFVALLGIVRGRAFNSKKQTLNGCQPKVSMPPTSEL